MSGTQQLVGLAGVGLVAVNAWTGQQHQGLAPLWTGSDNLDGAHAVAKQIGVELVGVTALVVIAGTGSTAAKSCLAIVGTLWLLFLMAGPHSSKRTWTGPLPGLGPLLPPPTGQGPTRTTLPRNTIPMPGMP